MNNSACNQTAEATQNKSVIFKLWCQLLAKRKNSISIRVLCIFLITTATIVTWVIQLSLQFISLLAEVVLKESSDSDETEADEPRRDDPWSDFSMSLNGWD